MGTHDVNPTTPKKQWISHTVLQYCYEQLKLLADDKLVFIDKINDEYRIGRASNIGRGSTICDALIKLNLNKEPKK